jgi:hypothetical protein
MALPAYCRWLVVAAVVPILSCSAQIAVGTVAGGQFNVAAGNWAFVGAGEVNYASGNFSAVTGGVENTASGYASAILGGDGNQANGAGSMAMGTHADALHDYSGVMSFSVTPCSSYDDYTLTVCAPNGFFVNGVNVEDVRVQRQLCVG